MRLTAGRRAARLRRDRADQEELPHAGDPGRAGGELHQRRGAGRRLGSGAGRPPPHRGGQPQDPARPARDHAGPDPRCHRHHQDDAPAGPDGRAALHPGEQAVQPARGAASSAWCTNWCPPAAPTCSCAAHAALAWIAANPQAQQPWDDKDYKIPGGTPSNPKIAGMLTVAPAMLKKNTRGLYPAPEAALAAMVEGAMVDYDTATRIESRYLAKLIVSPVAKNMINTFFFNMNAIKSGQSRPKDVPRYKPQEGRHPGRRHDGRRHRLRPGQPRHRHRAERREPGERRSAARPTAPSSRRRGSTRAA